MFLQPVQRTDQRQGLVVNAQLQQAICLLQMSNTELQSYIEKEAHENPFLDVEDQSSKKERDYTYEPRSTVSRASNDDFDFIAERAENPDPSLYGHVGAQFDLIFTDPKEREIADIFMESLEPSGWGNHLTQLPCVLVCRLKRLRIFWRAFKLWNLQVYLPEV